MWCDQHGSPIKGLAVLYEPSIDFPSHLLVAGIEGGAEIAVTVHNDGSVLDPHVVVASHAEFGAAAKQCVATWKFRPLVESALTEPVRAHCHFTFKTN